MLLFQECSGPHNKQTDLLLAEELDSTFKSEYLLILYHILWSQDFDARVKSIWVL